MSMIWPIALVVFSNIVYQICAKGVPKNMDAMASMTIIYLVGAVCSAIMYFALNENGDLLQEYRKTNTLWRMLIQDNNSSFKRRIEFIYFRF